MQIKRSKLLCIVFVIYTVYTLIYMSNTEDFSAHLEYHRLSAANSNAKLTFTNTVTYLTKCSVNVQTNDFMLPDGIYCGCLITEKGKEYSPVYDGSAYDYDICMKMLFGAPNYNMGYYCTVINDGTVSQCYFGFDGSFLKNASRLSAAVEKGEPWQGRDGFGGYPNECYDHEADPLGNDVSSLPILYEGGDIPFGKIKRQQLMIRLNEYAESISCGDIFTLIFLLYPFYAVFCVIFLIMSVKIKRSNRKPV